MTNGKVITLYMTMPDMIRAGHRMICEDFDCDASGIIGGRDYDNDIDHDILLVSKKSYDIIEEAELVLDKGILLENIYVDIDLNHLKKDSIIQIGETLFEVVGPCNAFNYLYALAPELPELLVGQRGIFITPVEYGSVSVGNEVKIIKEA